MTTKDVFLAKASTVDKCLRAIDSIRTKSNLEDWERESIFSLQIQRACQATIDAANVVIAHLALELPRSAAHSFEILVQEKLISEKIKNSMKKMVGFRNIAVHNYTEVDPKILQAIVEQHLDDFRKFFSELKFVF